jgi:hypothetical protein
MERNRWISLAAVFVMVTVAASTLWSQASPGQAPDKPAVTAWGYKTLFGTVSQSNDEELNRLGKDGWELFAIQPEGEGNGVVRFVLKRPSPK